MTTAYLLEWIDRAIQVDAATFGLRVGRVGPLSLHLSPQPTVRPLTPPFLDDIGYLVSKVELRPKVPCPTAKRAEHAKRCKPNRWKQCEWLLLQNTVHGNNKYIYIYIYINKTYIHTLYFVVALLIVIFRVGKNQHLCGTNRWATNTPKFASAHKWSFCRTGAQVGIFRFHYERLGTDCADWTGWIVIGQRFRSACFFFLADANPDPQRSIDFILPSEGSLAKRRGTKLEWCVRAWVLSNWYYWYYNYIVLDMLDVSSQIGREDGRPFAIRFNGCNICHFRLRSWHESPLFVNQPRLRNLGDKHGNLAGCPDWGTRMCELYSVQDANTFTKNILVQFNLFFSMPCALPITARYNFHIVCCKCAMGQIKVIVAQPAKGYIMVKVSLMPAINWSGLFPNWQLVGLYLCPCCIPMFKMLTMECWQLIELLACNSFSTTKCSTTRAVPCLLLAVVCNPAAGSSRKNRRSETRFAGHHRGQLPVSMISKRICHYSTTGPTTRHESVFVSMNVLIPLEWIIKMTSANWLNWIAVMLTWIFGFGVM